MSATYIARRYTFRASHQVDGMNPPWCERHEHDYTVEVVYAAEGVAEVVIDTDLVDAAWHHISQYLEGRHLNDTVGGRTTVEDLACRFCAELTDAIGDEDEDVVAHSVTVWEDDSRWGRYEP